MKFEMVHAILPTDRDENFSFNSWVGDMMEFADAMTLDLNQSNLPDMISYNRDAWEVLADMIISGELVYTNKEANNDR